MNLAISKANFSSADVVDIVEVVAGAVAVAVAGCRLQVVVAAVAFAADQAIAKKVLLPLK